MVKDGSQRAMDSGHKNEDAVASKTAKGIVKDNSSQRASLGNDDANQAGSFFIGIAYESERILGSCDGAAA